jgi:hypothetical protein
LRDYPGFVEWLPGDTYLAVKTMVCGGDLGVISTLKKNLNILKCFDLENIGYKLLYAN